MDVPDRDTSSSAAASIGKNELEVTGIEKQLLQTCDFAGGSGFALRGVGSASSLDDILAGAHG